MRQRTSPMCCLTVALIVVVGGMSSMVNAQTSSPPNWEEIKKQAEAEKAAVEAQRQLLEQQKQLIEARKALEAAQAPADAAKKALDDQIAAARAAKDLADAQKAAADAAKAAAEARKAQSDAALAAFKAQIGEVPTSPYTGAVELKDKAGVTEAALLSGRAAQTAAERITSAVTKKAGGGAVDASGAAQPKPKVLLYAAAEIPNFQALTAFRAHVGLVERAFSEAQAASNAADEAVPKPPDFKIEAVPVAAAAGLGVDALNKLLAFFKTDYTVGGVELKFEDALLVHAVAGRMAERFDVALLAAYNPQALSDAGAKVLTRFTALSRLKQTGQSKMAEHDQLVARFTADAEKATEPNKTDLRNKAKVHRTAADAWKTAIALYDGLFAKLTTADDKGLTPLTTVIRETVVADALATDTFLLVVKLHTSGGAYYTKKNMWTFFGGMPFFHMGGVVASFAFLDGKSGTVLASDIVPVHGGFERANKVQHALEAPPATRPK